MIFWDFEDTVFDALWLVLFREGLGKDMGDLVQGCGSDRSSMTAIALSSSIDSRRLKDTTPLSMTTVA